MEQTVKGPPYKSRLNHWYTRALFREIAMLTNLDQKPDIKPVFSLHGDYPGLINARKTFVHLRDPTGYQWAMLYLGDWAHWKALMKCKWFVEALGEWQAELDIAIQSENIQRIQAIAKDESDKGRGAAAKWLAEKQYKEKKGPGRGRPTKEELQGELKKQAEASQSEDADLERIGLKLVK